MQGTELVVTSTLCFTNGGFHISMEISYPASVGTSVLVCGQSIYSYFQLFLNPARRPQDALRQRRDGVKEKYYV